MSHIREPAQRPALWWAFPRWLGRAALVVTALLGTSGAGQQDLQTDKDFGTQSLAAKVSKVPGPNCVAGLQSALSKPAFVGPARNGLPTCGLPPTSIEASKGCALGRRYPQCKWWLAPAGDKTVGYAVWRNTSAEHLAARPELVALVLETAAAYVEQFPEDELVVGDLDAAGPRHNTHDRGVDVDLYLPGVMWEENEGNGVVTDNYALVDKSVLREKRTKVLALAKALTACSRGRVRIYYNDPPVIEAFNRWFEAQGFYGPFGKPMQSHNDLHRFHFHVTLADEPELVPDPET